MQIILGTVFIILVTAFLYSVLFAFPVMWLWNWLMPVVFGLPLINIWQSVGLLWLSAILIKSHSSN